MDINTIVNLSSRAWSLNILALMHEGVPGRQAPLLAKTSAGRTAFAASLLHLVEIGMLEKNPGHGHPLRPEFRLTEQGKVAARVAHQIVGLSPDDKGFVLLRRAWSIPILALTSGPTRFSTLKDSLQTISDRALSMSLVKLEERNWLERKIDLTSRHPFPTYQAANEGRAINNAIGLADGRF
ncbi:winged helix-turn-helix transcriptional regulator [Maritalea porphyrae]|uniref:winged helix-turn-helix transcriptional regulator n=1 Tax=Maritalea porphyrae TaxID=880732 RepID=UPI0022AF402D|nr:winged helix-turn-helix transcriptional regulator [Maritalea porphyrae]MCZ4273693.1 winged helix-turn-helix transcriptional regulator [Maritalea porphyrae]